MADQLKRIADALDGGDPNVGTPSEEGNLKRIADYIVENGISGGASEPLMINLMYDLNDTVIMKMDVLAVDIYDAFKSGRVCIVNTKPKNWEEAGLYDSPEGYGYVVHCTHESILAGSKLQITVQSHGTGTTTFYEDDEGYPHYSYV